MANRVVVQEGYKIPFAEFEGYRRRKKRKKGGHAKQANKMRACAKRWKHSGKKGSYRSFMKRCLK